MLGWPRRATRRLGHPTVHLPDGSYRVTRPLQVELGELRVTAGTDAVITSALSEPAGDGEAEVAVLEARGAGTVSIEGLAVQHSATGRGLVASPTAPSSTTATAASGWSPRPTS